MDLRSQLVRVEKEVFRLQQEKTNLQMYSTGNKRTDDIMREVQEADFELRNISRKFEDIELRYQNKEDVFRGSKSYMDEIFEKLKI